MKITPLTEINMYIIFNIDNVSSKAVTNSELGIQIVELKNRATEIIWCASCRDLDM